MRSVRVTLDGQEYAINELRSRANAEWRKRLEEPFGELAGALESAPAADLTDGQALGGLVRSVSGMLLRSVETVKGLLVGYAPELEPVMGEAYDSEILDAFVEVLQLAYPFGGILERVRGIGSGIGQMKRS